MPREHVAIVCEAQVHTIPTGATQFPWERHSSHGVARAMAYRQRQRMQRPCRDGGLGLLREDAEHVNAALEVLVLARTHRSNVAVDAPQPQGQSRARCNVGVFANPVDAIVGKTARKWSSYDLHQDASGRCKAMSTSTHEAGGKTYVPVPCDPVPRPPHSAMSRRC